SPARAWAGCSAERTSARERGLDLGDVDAVVPAAARDVAVEGDGLVVPPRGVSDALEVGGRRGGAEADVSRAQGAPNVERGVRVGVEGREPRRAEAIVRVEPRKQGTLLGEDESQNDRRADLIEHEMANDVVSRPLAGGGTAVEPIGRDPLH